MLCMYVLMIACMHAYMCFVCVYVCVYICVCMCMYVCMYYVCIFIQKEERGVLRVSSVLSGVGVIIDQFHDEPRAREAGVVVAIDVCA